MRAFREAMKRVGALVELPAYYPYLSARRNLEVIRRMRGGAVARGRVAEILERVGLGDRIDDRVATFSQGMRQRLGIAMALLSSPRLVILDEPTNGLDPGGILDIRRLILDMNRQQGVTFFISSHLLHEVEITCTRVGILRQGKLAIQSDVRALLQETAFAVRIETLEPDRAAQAMKDLSYVRSVDREEGGALRVSLSARAFSDLNAALVQRGIPVEAFSPLRLTLEEYFIRRGMPANPERQEKWAG